MLMPQHPAVPEHYGHEEHVHCAAPWTQSMLMSQLALGSSPEHHGHEEHVYRVPLWTRRVC
jgi:hypothetical protein